MTGHSHNWYDEENTGEIIIDSSNNVDTKKLEENIHAIKLSRKIYEEAHPTNECPLTKEEKAAEDDEWIKKFIKNTDLNIRALKTTINNLQEKTDQLTQTVLTNTSERVKSKTKIGKNDMKELVPRNLPIEHPYEEPTPFPGRLKGQKVVQPYMPLSPFRDKANVANEEELDIDIPLQDGVMQLMTAYITPLGDVASATIPILDKHLNEFEEDFSDITKVVEMRDGNSINDVKGLSDIIKTDDFETFIQKLVHRVDDFACPVSFPWHTDKNISKDPLPKSTKFKVDDYAILVVHPAPFQKFPEPFIYLVKMSRYYTLDKDTYPRFLHDDKEGWCLSLYIIHLVVFDLVFDYLFVYAKMDLFAFIHVVGPTKVEIVVRERTEGGKKRIESIVGHVVPLLPVSSAHSKRYLEASVDKLFDEGGSTNQGGSASSGGHNAKIELATDVEDIAAKNVTAERPKRQRKKASVGSVLKELLTSIIMSDEVGVTAVATLPFITSSISAMLEHEGGDHTDSVNGPNLCTIGLAKRFITSSHSSHHSSTNPSGAEVDSIIMYVVLPPVMIKAVVTSHAVSAPFISVLKTKTNITSLGYASIFYESGSTEQRGHMLRVPLILLNKIFRWVLKS
nr:hypothetical protein [Tanacetum cinerariifolium]